MDHKDNMVPKDVMDWWEVAFCGASHSHVLDAQWQMLKNTQDPTFKNALLLVEQRNNIFENGKDQQTTVHEGATRSVQPGIYTQGTPIAHSMHMEEQTPLKRKFILYGLLKCTKVYSGK